MSMKGSITFARERIINDIIYYSRSLSTNSGIDTARSKESSFKSNSNLCCELDSLLLAYIMHSMYFLITFLRSTFGHEDLKMTKEE
jgi:hypothetical protein